MIINIVVLHLVCYEMYASIAKNGFDEWKNMQKQPE